MPHVLFEDGETTPRTMLVLPRPANYPFIYQLALEAGEAFSWRGRPQSLRGLEEAIWSDTLRLRRSSAGSVGQVRPGRAGGWFPSASRARAMRGSGPWKPNAIRVRRRILVLVDSIRALESPESRA